MTNLINKIIFLLGSLLCFHASIHAQERILLAGEWSVRLDEQGVGEKEQWYKGPFERKVQLPGTLDDAGIGNAPSITDSRVEREVMLHLTRKHSYIGYAWYARQIDIPQEWKGRSIELFLERVLWNSRIWIDGKEMGMQESLSAPHRYELELAPGRHLLVIRIDNRKQYDISVQDMAHAYTDGTQIIWNGIIGKMMLVARNKAHIHSLQVFPSLKDGAIRVRTILDKGGQGKAGLLLRVLDRSGRVVASMRRDIVLSAGQTEDLTTIIMKGYRAWDEFSPYLYTMAATLTTGAGAKDELSAVFGMREVDNRDGMLWINGRRLFLRGTLECNIFPLAGHPPMDKRGWVKVFATAKQYGLNHLRFHSWCPPEAAFEVADSLGFYIQVELPLWSKHAGEEAKTNDFLEAEAACISREYGNHPSFCLWSMGNELEGDLDWLAGLVGRLRRADPRHLYTTTTFSFQPGHGKWPEPADDYYITQYTRKGWIRGQGIFNTYPPAFNADYTASIDSMPVPVIIHEMGQYSVYPALKEIDKYTGVLDPLNFKAIRNDLDRKGMAGLASDFTLASGKFSANLYKEEIERALRTKGMSGFELLDLHDFPGQGTALIGILDAFWDSKGLVRPEEHRMYCSAVVPLIRFDKASYTSGETFTARVEVANFSNGVLQHSVPLWKVADVSGQVIASGSLGPADIAIGNGQELGSFSVDLGKIKKATTLTITLSLPGTSYHNQWRIWVYPEMTGGSVERPVFAKTLKEAVEQLGAGKNVLLNPDTAAIFGVAGRFAPVFWSPVHFPNQPGTMGILCDPRHPALKDFPTEGYSDWQWWDLITSSKTMILDSLPKMEPIVRVIDNFFKNRKMGDVIEARVGKGKLILVSADITHDLDKRPGARQLRYSLERYMASSDFNPMVGISPEQLRWLVHDPDDTSLLAGDTGRSVAGSERCFGDTVIARYKRYLLSSGSAGDIRRTITSYEPTGQWPDINYADTQRANWQPLNHLGKIAALSFAWADPGSTYYHDTVVWERINGALDHWLARRYWSSNWWSNEIGVPRIMRDILVLVHDSLSPSRLAGALQIMKQLRVQQTGQGANLIWSADLGLHYGALTEDDTLARRCARLIADEIRITTGEGIQPDRSFHQHEARLQMYQYGAAFVQSNTRLAWQLEGTGWALPEEKIDLLTDFVLKGWQWMERGINTVPGTIDRSASRVSALHSADIREWIPYLCKLCPQKAQQLSAIADCQNGKGENLSGFRYYPYSDFAVYQAPRFSFFLKTISDRTLPSESINSENLKGGLLNSGDAYVIKNGREYFNLMPVWDWSKLPGVTAFEGAARIARRPFAGSVSDGRSGLTAMDYDMEGHNGQSMTARKCWIVHDDLVISLIADLQRNYGEGPLYTTLDQCRWQGDVSVDRPGNILQEGAHTFHGVRWIHHAGLGYIFLQPQTVQLSMGMATGTWNAINHSETAAPVTEKLFTPVMIHGMGTTPLSAGYVLAYRETAAALQLLVEKPSWTILRNDKAMQAVQFADGSMACAFYTKGAIGTISVDRPCLVLVAGGHVYASDPAQRGGVLNIGINGKMRSISLPGNGTTVDL